MRAAGLLAMLASAACVREPAEAACPALAPGELVVTEVRYARMSDDPLGTWIELHNASGREVDLRGIKLRLRDPQDSRFGGVSILVRSPLPAAPGSFTVLGLFEGVDPPPPPHVDYGFLRDYLAAGRGWDVAGGAIHVESCGAEIDSVEQHLQTPAMGSYSLGGVPDANRNDNGNLWCNDRTQVGAAFPGTPRSQNITCPLTP